MLKIMIKTMLHKMVQKTIKHKLSIICALGCLALGMFSGAISNTSTMSIGQLKFGMDVGSTSWFNTLIKPSYQPPSWVFGPVWTVLYILMGIGLSRIIKLKHSLLLLLFIAQFSLNLIWSPVFFRMHLIQEALYIIIALWCLVVSILFLSRKHPKIMVLFIPYFLWISFASTLSYQIVKLN